MSARASKNQRPVALAPAVSAVPASATMAGAFAPSQGAETELLKPCALVPAEIPDLLVALSASGEVGSVSRQSGQYAPQVEAAGNHSPVDQQAPEGRVVPEVYTSPAVLKAISTLEAAAKDKPQQRHVLELTEREFLHAYFAVEHDRDRTRKAMKKGLACFEDLKATDGLWRKLQAVMFARLPQSRGQA